MQKKRKRKKVNIEDPRERREKKEGGEEGIWEKIHAKGRNAGKKGRGNIEKRHEKGGNTKRKGKAKEGQIHEKRRNEEREWKRGNIDARGRRECKRKGKRRKEYRRKFTRKEGVQEIRKEEEGIQKKIHEKGGSTGEKGKGKRREGNGGNFDKRKTSPIDPTI